MAVAQLPLRPIETPAVLKDSRHETQSLPSAWLVSPP